MLDREDLPLHGTVVLDFSQFLAGPPRVAGKPLWQLLVEMDPEVRVDTLDLTYLGDVLTREEAAAMLAESVPDRAERVADLARTGYPCYTTSAGWLGYSDDKLRRLAAEALEQGFRHIKLKVGADLEDDVRRCSIAREVIGWDVGIATLVKTEISSNPSMRAASTRSGGIVVMKWM